MIKHMDPEPLPRIRRPSISISRLTAWTFIVFLFLAFVGLQPFAPRNVLDAVEISEGGDTVRQFLFVGIAAIVGVCAFAIRRGYLPGVLPIPLLIAFGWCGASLVWSPVPEIGLRRLVLTYIVAVTVFGIVHVLGIRRTIRLLALTITSFVFASLLSGLIVPNAVHQAGEMDSALVGNWRGIFFHKNHAGAVAAVTIIVGTFLWLSERRRLWIAAVIAGVLLLILSVSKTSAVLIAPAITVGLVFCKMSRTSLGRTVFLLLIAFVFIVLCLLAALYSEQLNAILSDRTALTGRTEIWELVVRMIADSPVIGFGYGSIFDVGAESPLLQYGSSWVLEVAHAHNGYLEAALSTGIVGLGIAFIGFFIVPLFWIVRTQSPDPYLSGMLVALLSFIALHNMMETSLLDRASRLWVTLLIVWFVARSMRYSTRNKE